MHRLDRDTSGVLLFALDARAHHALSMAFENAAIEKRYLALVTGRVEHTIDIDAPLGRSGRGRMRVEDGGKPARTIVTPLEVFASSTLVEAVPITGRTHQIRVHLSHAGHPLVFDHQYGPRVPLPSGLARTPLHASSVVLPALEGVDSSPVRIESPLPPDMSAALAALASESSGGAEDA